MWTGGLGGCCSVGSILSLGEKGGGEREQADAFGEFSPG